MVSDKPSMLVEKLSRTLFPLASTSNFAPPAPGYAHHRRSSTPPEHIPLEVEL